mgnify:CR=1 FL=1
MNNVQLFPAEQRAEKAENLDAFSGIKLLHIKSKVAEILDLIGRNEIFDEYTKHDISHVDTMLKMLDWIVPQKTTEMLTSADWLMTVLSFYFHDLGMLVTKEEFENRNNTVFSSYKDSVLKGELGVEYKQKIINLGHDKAEKFLYQEFVRNTHAERIKNWIQGHSDNYLGKSDLIIDEINKLLDKLDPKFRKDLGIICESHHLDDLGDFSKYKTHMNYGNSDDEVVNLQYVAVILRTADLLHITSDRTPSIMFNLINPNDPISQNEWYKQMAVKAVKPMIKKNKDGNLDEGISKDTIEVTAYFDKPEKADCFFGLIAYLNYARKELQRNHDWIEKAKKTQGVIYDYPWKDIDDNNIETEGFERKLFEFNLDQAKILKLLVGHTLYNDSTVVLRELIQNSIDAIKLQYLIDQSHNNKAQCGEININWDSSQYTLSIIDSGTGMTSDIIENHLLKVGSSRYQEEEFKKKYPGFSPISRFGIGILTCFMIADDVDIITCSLEEEKIMKLTIRKIDGKYLLQYINKEDVKSKIMPHGTEIKLKVRHEINMLNLEDDIKKWILYPPCEIFLSIDHNKPINIGYNKPKDALEQYLTNIGYDPKNEYIMIKEETINGVTLAYALHFYKYFKEWSFLENSRAKKNSYSPIGTCIEGIRVEFDSPGYIGNNIIATANASGANAPKTNVARSTIEAAEERDILLSSIYTLYTNHVKEEILDLYKSKGFSLTWASSEALYLLRPLIHNLNSDTKFEPISKALLSKAINEIPAILVEQDNKRISLSPNDIQNKHEIWTIDSNLIRSAESLIREASVNSSLSSLMNSLYTNDEYKLNEMNCLLCGFNSDNLLHTNALLDKEVSFLRIYQKERRVDLKWECKDSNIHWLEYCVHNSDSYRYSNPFTVRNREHKVRMFFEINANKVGVNDEIAVKAHDMIFVLNNSELHNYLLETFKILDYNNSREDNFIAEKLLDIILFFFNSRYSNDSDIDNIFQRYLSEMPYEFKEKHFWAKINKAELMSILKNTYWKVFDVSVWSRLES